MTKKILLNKLLFFIIIINFLFEKYVSINEEWKKYSFNPVLGNNQTGTVFDPFVIKHDNIYKMVVSWRNKGVIALSTSKDGNIWSNLKIILNNGDKQSWESIINRGCLVIINNKYYLYYKCDICIYKIFNIKCFRILQ